MIDRIGTAINAQKSKAREKFRTKKRFLIHRFRLFKPIFCCRTDQGRTEDFVRGGEIFFHELKVVTSNEKRRFWEKLKFILQN